MHIEVYDGNLVPTKVLDRQVTQACDFFAAHHLDIATPVRVILHNSHLPYVEAMYHGLYRIDGKSRHLTSMLEPATHFSFPDPTHNLIHELTHTVQAESGDKQKPKNYNPLLGYTVDSFIQHAYNEDRRIRGSLTLANVVSEGVAMFAETTYIKGPKGTIFDGIMRRKILADQQASLLTAMRTIYPAHDTPLVTYRDEVDEYAIGYRMMSRFGKVWSRINADKYLLKAMTQLDLRAIAGIPVLARRGGLNPEFLHYYHHPEELPVAPIRT